MSNGENGACIKLILDVGFDKNFFMAVKNGRAIIITFS